MDELKQNIVEVLASVYKRVNWKRMGSRSAYDVFAHRLKVAGYRDSIPKFLEKLCHGLQLQSVNISPELLQSLETDEARALEMIREESVYLTLLAAKRAKEIKYEGGTLYDF